MSESEKPTPAEERKRARRAPEAEGKPSAWKPGEEVVIILDPDRPGGDPERITGKLVKLPQRGSGARKASS